MLQKALTLYREIRRHKSLTADSSQSWKYYSRWKKTLIEGKSSLDFGLPWFTFQAIDYIDQHLPEGARVFEFGGGGSTVFFQKKKCHVYTVEHHKEWFENISKSFQSTTPAWNGYLIEAEQGDLVAAPEIENPLHYTSDDEGYKTKNFKSYATKIDGFENGFFDLVLVDGRSRPSCVYHSIDKIKKGGYLVIDNSERDYYNAYFNANFASQFEKELDVFGPVPYITWFHKTTIYRKK